MWSLGKCIGSPEVPRVYIGSFWDQPLRNEEMRPLFEAEMRDLIADLKSLPKNNAMRKVNELVKRARLAKTHAFIIGHFKDHMPSFFGREKAQKKMVKNLADEFNKVRLQYRLPVRYPLRVRVSGGLADGGQRLPQPGALPPDAGAAGL
jgi:hypothetical protein